MILQEAIEKVRQILVNEHGEDLTDTCEESSEFLYLVLHKLGFKPAFSMGYFKGNSHCWIFLDDGTLIDITLDQFGEEYDWGIIAESLFPYYQNYSFHYLDLEIEENYLPHDLYLYFHETYLKEEEA